MNEASLNSPEQSLQPSTHEPMSKTLVEQFRNPTWAPVIGEVKSSLASIGMIVPGGYEVGVSDDDGFAVMLGSLDGVYARVKGLHNREQETVAVRDLGIEPASDQEYIIAKVIGHELTHAAGATKLKEVRAGEENAFAISQLPFITEAIAGMAEGLIQERFIDKPTALAKGKPTGVDERFYSTEEERSLGFDALPSARLAGAVLSAAIKQSGGNDLQILARLMPGQPHAFDYIYDSLNLVQDGLADDLIEGYQPLEFLSKTAMNDGMLVDQFTTYKEIDDFMKIKVPGSSAASIVADYDRSSLLSGGYLVAGRLGVPLQRTGPKSPPPLPNPNLPKS